MPVTNSEPKPNANTARSANDTLCDMEDAVRAANDFAGLLNDRLTDINPISAREQGRLGRLSGEIIANLNQAIKLIDEAFEARRRRS